MIAEVTCVSCGRGVGLAQARETVFGDVAVQAEQTDCVCGGVATARLDLTMVLPVQPALHDPEEWRP